MRSKPEVIQEWLRKYDRGEFDSTLRELGKNRIATQSFRTPTSENRAVLVSKVVGLLNVGILPSIAAIKSMGASIARKRGSTWGNFGRPWAARILADAKKKSCGYPLIGKMDEEGATAVITGTHVDLKDRSKEWNGATPDTVFKKPCVYEGMSEGDILGCMGTPKFASPDEYRDAVCASGSPKDMVDGHCFKASHRNKSISRSIDPAAYWECGAKDIAINFGDSSIKIATMPPCLINELRECLHSIYGGREGVGISSTALNNSSRKLPGGRMACLVVKEMNGDVAVSYASCRTDSHGAKGNSLETIRRLSSKFGDWFKVAYPDEWETIRSNNLKEGWKFPPYFNDPNIISPRIFVTDRLANEAHMDFKDIGPCVVFWIKDNATDNEKDWQFIFEDIRTGEDEGKRDTLAVQLYDGLVIIFDGTKVRHCTSVPDASSPRKFGVYHGTSKVRKRKTRS